MHTALPIPRILVTFLLRESSSQHYCEVPNFIDFLFQCCFCPFASGCVVTQLWVLGEGGHWSLVIWLCNELLASETSAVEFNRNLYYSTNLILNHIHLSFLEVLFLAKMHQTQIACHQTVAHFFLTRSIVYFVRLHFHLVHTLKLTLVSALTDSRCHNSDMIIITYLINMGVRVPCQSIPRKTFRLYIK